MSSSCILYKNFVSLYVANMFSQFVPGLFTFFIVFFFFIVFWWTEVLNFTVAEFIIILIYN